MGLIYQVHSSERYFQTHSTRWMLKISSILQYRNFNIYKRRIYHQFIMLSMYWIFKFILCKFIFETFTKIAHAYATNCNIIKKTQRTLKETNATVTHSNKHNFITTQIRFLLRDFILSFLSLLRIYTYKKITFY